MNPRTKYKNNYNQLDSLEITKREDIEFKDTDSRKLLEKKQKL
jgi:hypothetical protein